MPSVEGFLILNTLAIEEVAKEDKHTPIKKITPTKKPILRLLILVSRDSIRQAKNVAVKHTGHGTESQRKVLLERSLPRIVTPVASIFCVTFRGITPTR